MSPSLCDPLQAIKVSSNDAKLRVTLQSTAKEDSIWKSEVQGEKKHNFVAVKTHETQF